MKRGHIACSVVAGLITCSDLQAVIATAATSKEKIAVVGEWWGHHSGAFRIRPEDLAAMKANFDSKTKDCVIDYDHATLWSFDPAVAGGWIRSLEVIGEELWGNVEWTEDAIAKIRAKEYKYLSPVFEQNHIDEKSGDAVGMYLHSVALTNTPFLDELGQLRANSAKAKTSDTNSNQNKGDDNMSDKKGETPTQQSTSDSDVLQAENAELKAKNDELTKQVAESAVNQAISEGKISEEQKVWANSYALKDIEGFKTYCNSATSKKQNTPQSNMFANGVAKKAPSAIGKI